MRELLDDPLNEVKAAKRWALAGITAAVAILVPIYALALGLSVWSLVLVLAPAAVIVFLGIELASRWEYRMRRRYAYPHRLGYELAPIHDFSQACSWGAELLAEWLRAEAVVVAWLTEDGQSLKPVAAHGLSERWLKEAATVSVQSAGLDECIKSGRMPPSRSTEGSPWFGELAGRGRVVHVPLVSDSRTQGVLAVAARTGNQMVGDRRLLAALGTVMGLALDNCRLYEAQKAHADYLQEINRMKSDFLQTVSHELRTPLTSIMVAAEMLLEDEEESDPGSARARLVSNIVKGAQRLSSLVKDLVDVSREDQFKPRLDLDSVRLADLVASAVGVIQPLAASKHQTVTVEVHSREATVLVDRLRFEQVLINLLSNAQRYSPENGEIKVRTFEDGAETIIAVIDSGPGVAREDRDLIFEPFYRANRSGLGLGLAIAKSLVELHQGRILVADEPGGGSAFVVALPSQSVRERPGLQAQVAH
jgi:signal transduction histidine kinase